MNENGRDRVVLEVTNVADLIDKIAQFDQFAIAGRVYCSEMLIPQLSIDSKDLIAEAGSCPGFILFWGVEASRARRFHAQVESSYRMWRDRTFLEIKSEPLEATGKVPSDAVADKMCRADPDYGNWRSRLDDAQESAELAEAVQEAFKAKARLIEVQERVLRDEAGGAYRVVESPRKSIPRQPQMEKYYG